jgi:catechol 2,3-dioxygenase-like lactoylglutathione lyase family enzyme
MSTARPRLVASSTCLVVSDLARSVAFYCDKLGFAEPAMWGDPPTFAMANRDGFDIMLTAAATYDQIRPHGPEGIWDLYLRVEDVRGEVEALRAAGVAIDSDLTETEYDMLEIEILDPDGYRVAIGSDLPV